MMFFKSILTVAALSAVASAFAVERNDFTRDDTSASEVRLNHWSTFADAKAACEKSDLADCTEYCTGFGAKADCLADGDKVTCRCAPAKKETECENCLICLDNKLSFFQTHAKDEELK